MAELISRACPNRDCRRFGIKYQTFTFCTECGTKMHEVQPCCKDSEGSTLSHHKFCPYCGSSNQGVKFKPTAVVLIIVGLFLFTSSAFAEPWKITAYDACVKCCGKADGITASGRVARPDHTIACNWLPFGTKVRIGDKIYTVEDRGAKSLFGTKKNPIKHIDVFFKTHKEARSFGVQYLDVEVLK